MRMRSVRRARRAAMRASAICRRASTRHGQRLQRIDRCRPARRDRSGTSASGSARRTDPRRHARRGSRPADAVRLGIHGTSDSSAITRSASASSAPGSKPKCSGWLDGRHNGARIVRDHRDGAAFRKMGEQRHRGGGQRGGDDQRPLGRRDPFGQRRDGFRIGMRRRRLRARLDRRDRLRQRRRQRLARQHQIDRAARMRHRDFHAARDHVAGLGGHAQFVVPLHQFAHHAGLVEHFLRPVNRPVARAERSFFGDRRAAGAEDQRHPVARQVGEVVDGVGGADIDVHHHRLRAAGHQIGAVRHGDRQVLVRNQDRLRHLGIGLLGAAEGFHDRRKIGAGIAEEIIDAVVGERAQERFGGDRWPLAPGRCERHAFRPGPRPPGGGRCYWLCQAVLRDGRRG